MTKSKQRAVWVTRDLNSNNVILWGQKPRYSKGIVSWDENKYPKSISCHYFEKWSGIIIKPGEVAKVVFNARKVRT